MSWTKSLIRGVPLLERKEGDPLLDVLISRLLIGWCRKENKAIERIDIDGSLGIYMLDAGLRALATIQN